MSTPKLRWWEGWVFAWRLARMLRLSCKVDLHIRFKDQPSCLCRREGWALPLMRLDLTDEEPV